MIHSSYRYLLSIAVIGIFIVIPWLEIINKPRLRLSAHSTLCKLRATSLHLSIILGLPVSLEDYSCEVLRQLKSMLKEWQKILNVEGCEV